ncbi:MAG: hypothetical protein IKF07_04125 [Eubacterium sp.]|nr:hypothetical protein [Eubacterium sp.]
MFSIKIADHVFDIDNRYPYLEDLCRDYLTDERNGRYISVSDEEMEREQSPDAEFPPEYHESTAVYRKICELLIPDGIFLFHCSAVSIDGRAVLFGAPSGTGKSTHAKLWRQVFDDRVQIINDDKPLIRIDGDTVLVYGTPWAGKHSMQTNINVPVRALFMLERAKENSVETLSIHDAYPLALNQTYRPDDVMLMKKTLELMNGLLDRVPVYRLKCSISEDAVNTAYSVIGDKR